MPPTRNLYERASDAAIWAAAERAADDRGVSMSQLVAAALAAYLGEEALAEPAPAPVEEPSVADIVKAAVAEATSPLRDELALMKSALATVKVMPEPGGPVAMRTASQALAARGIDAASLRAQAADLLARADEIRRSDPTLARGFHDRAAELLERADS